MNDRATEYLADAVTAVTTLCKAVEEEPSPVEPKDFKQFM